MMFMTIDCYYKVGVHAVRGVLGLVCIGRPAPTQAY